MKILPASPNRAAMRQQAGCGINVVTTKKSRGAGKSIAAEAITWLAHRWNDLTSKDAEQTKAEPAAES